MNRIESYKDSDAINQSLLVSLSKGVASFRTEKKKFYEEKTHFVIGSLFDVMLTMPEHKDEFFLSRDLSNKPSDTIMAIVHNLYQTGIAENNVRIMLSDYPDQYIINACEQESYGGKWKDSVKIDRVIREGSSYYDQLVIAKDRQIISGSEYELVEELVDEVKNHEHVNWIFKLKQVLGVEVLFQHPVYWKEDDVDCKALLDIVIINNNDVPIITLNGLIRIPPKSILPIDVKTLGGFLSDFHISVKKRRYDVQGAWYSRGISVVYNDYIVLPFMFLVVTKATNEPPMFFEMTKVDLSIGRWGGYKDMYRNWKSLEYNWDFDLRSLGSYDAEIMGWEQMLNLYRWHRDNDLWELNREIYLSKGLIKGVL